MLDPHKFTGIEAYDKLWSIIQTQCQNASFGIHKIQGSCYRKPKNPKIIARLSIACNRNQESVEELHKKGIVPKYKTERPISSSTKCSFRLDFVCSAKTKHWYLIRPNVPQSLIAGLHQFHAQPSQESIRSKLATFTHEHLKFLKSMTTSGQFSVPQLTIAFNKYFSTSYTNRQIE